MIFKKSNQTNEFCFGDNIDNIYNNEVDYNNQNNNNIYSNFKKQQNSFSDTGATCATTRTTSIQQQQQNNNFKKRWGNSEIRGFNVLEKQDTTLKRCSSLPKPSSLNRVLLNSDKTLGVNKKISTTITTNQQQQQQQNNLTQNLKKVVNFGKTYLF